MPISAKIFQTQLDQHVWIAEKIKEILESNPKITPSEIAIISRKHKHLMTLVPVFEEMGINIAYDRGQDVLAKKEVVELIEILRFVDSLFELNQQPKEELLPVILTYEFWRLDPKDIFELTVYAYENRKSWINSMLEMGKHDLKVLAEFLLVLGKQSKEAFLEQVIDEVTGVSRQTYVGDDTAEENYEQIEQDFLYNPKDGKINVIESLDSDSPHLTKYISPYKWYYFDKDFDKMNQDQKSKTGYLSFLSALKVFRDSVRNYKSSKNKHGSEILKVKDLLEYVDLLKARKIQLKDNSSYNSVSDAVSLLTAHKAKGLEFEYVFLIDCTEDTWNGRGIVNKIGLPSNLALLPQSENLDDSLRLFFVALTRAKTYLTLTSYKYAQDGKEVQTLGCLAGLVEFEEVGTQEILEKAEITSEIKSDISPLTIWFNGVLRENNSHMDLNYYFKSQLENYKLSVTHLNSFLDLARGGPSYFLERNLFAFPQAKSPNAAYGTAMHASINELYKELKRANTIPELSFLLAKFKISLLEQRLLQKDEQKYLEKGLLNLEIYYKNQSSSFKISDRSEEDFKNQGVVLGEARITGKIDKMVFAENGGVEVVDFKTGKAHTKWNDSNLDTAIKLVSYRRQLVFYKLLVEHSRDYNKYKVNCGSLEFLDVPLNDSKTIILNTEISDQESLDLSKLIQVVYMKIVGLAHGLPLPDVAKYSQDLQGIEDFIQDLISE